MCETNVTSSRPVAANLMERCGLLHFYWRGLSCNTLPLSVRHLYPCIGPALMFIEWLSRLGARTFVPAGGDGRIAEYSYLHVLVFSTGVFARFRMLQHLGLVGDFPITSRAHELVRQQRSNQVGIVCLLRLQPFVFQCRDGLLRPAAGLLSLRPCNAPDGKQ